MSSLLTHPTFVLAAQSVVSALTISKTRPTSWPRFAMIPFHLQCLYIMRVFATDFVRPAFAGLHIGTAASFLLNYLDVALLSASETDAYLKARAAPAPRTHGHVNGSSNASKPDGRTDKPSRAPSISEDTSFLDALLLFLNFRHINTPQQVKNVPPHSSSNTTSTSSTPAFLTHNALTALCSYLIVDLIQQAPDPPRGTFSATRIPLFARLYSGALSPTSPAFREEMIARASITAGFWLTLYYWLTLIGSLCNILSVASRSSTPADCRPWFGPISSAYTVRKFWGTFWNQCLRRYLTRDVEAVTRKTLGMRSGVVRKYVELLGCFALSGLMHEAPNGIAKGVGTWDMSGCTALRFFVVQGLEVCVEDAVISVWRRVTGTEEKHDGKGGQMQGKAVKTSQRVLGYVWVAGFMVWSVPLWVYPTADANTVDDPGVLLGSIIKGLRSWDWGTGT